MEFVQFHPTSLYAPATPAVAAGTAPASLAGGRSFLITEAVRGEGGMLYNLGECWVAHPCVKLSTGSLSRRLCAARVARCSTWVLLQRLVQPPPTPGMHLALALEAHAEEFRSPMC